MPGFASRYTLLELEIGQLTAEGCVPDPEPWREQLRALGPDAPVEELDALAEELGALRPPDDFPFAERTDLEVIRNQRPRGARHLDAVLGERELFDRILGGWMGRCCGAGLGRPFAGVPFTEDPEHRQREKTVMWLNKAGALPLSGYVPAESAASVYGVTLADTASCRENIRAVEPDPVLESSMIAMRVLERSGLEMATADTALGWLTFYALDAAPPAETQAMVNMASLDAFARDSRLPEELAHFDWRRISVRQNPWRESNGAMARGVLYGMVFPGRMEQAAEFAWRDACASHVKNGVYASMFLAALVAAAFHEEDLAILVEHGLSEIPARCRLSSSVRWALRAWESTETWEEAWDIVMEEFGDLPVDHAILSTLLVLLALRYGEWDFGRVVGTAAMSGLDPAANAAAAGTVAGVRLSARAIQAEWTQPLNNTLKSRVACAMPQTTITDPARRCVEIAQRLCPAESEPVS